MRTIHDRFSFVLHLLAFASICAGCGSGFGRMTLAQELAWDRWKKCDNFPEITLKEIRSDGQIWVWYGAGHVTEWQECMRKARQEQVSQRLAGVPPLRVATQPVPPSSGGTPVAAPTSMTTPVWKPGDEWAFRWESPLGKGTFVWSVDREEVIDGVPHYVVKSGSQRQIFYRKSDLAWLMDKVGGVVEAKASPAQIRFVWPLTPGATWEQTVTTERPGDRATTTMVRACQVEGEQTVTVPAGSFHTTKTVCRNKQTNEVIHQTWYAPEVKYWVRELSRFSWGVQERELITFRVR